MKNIKSANIFISFLIALGFFFLARPVMVSALTLNNKTNFSYETEVKTDQDGFSQIIIKDQNGKVTFLTNEGMTHANPVIDGDLVVWTAQTENGWQIFLYDITTEDTLQLTKQGNNVNPQISGKYVAWEGYHNSTWQIFLFDGLKITQITSNDKPKQDLLLKSGVLAYSQKDELGWNIYSYNLTSKANEKLSNEYNNRNPHLDPSNPNKILWSAGDILGQDSITNEITFEYDLNTKNLKKIYKENSSSNTEESTSQEEEKPQQADEQETQMEEPSTITEDDIKEELGIIEETKDDVPESTQSEEKIPAPLIEDEKVKESTSSSEN